MKKCYVWKLEVYIISTKTHSDSETDIIIDFKGGGHVTCPPLPLVAPFLSI